MLITHEELATLASQLESQPESGLRLAATPVAVDPLDLVRAGGAVFGSAMFFSSPEGRVIGGLGAAQRVAASGPDRLRALDRAIAMLPPEAPVLCAFSFAGDGPGMDWDGFPNAVAVVPQATVTLHGGTSLLTVAVPAGLDWRTVLSLLAGLPDPGPVSAWPEVDHTVESRPHPEDWVGIVEEAISAIDAAVLEKVVLARTVVVRRPAPIDGFELVARLRDAYGDCRVFGWQEGDGVFLGASPELLIAKEHDHVEARPLAGSAPRGRDAESDRRLGEALLASAKDRREHDLVVTDVIARLEPLVERLHHPAIPQVLRFSTVQHLASPITATGDSRVLDLAHALHPTAAVGGVPRSEALRFIEKMEGIDRGWYGGGIGWVDPGGDGEIAVGLRCALVRPDRALLYAGNGIVAGSDPAQELEETRLKLRPLLDLLT